MGAVCAGHTSQPTRMGVASPGCSPPGCPSGLALCVFYHTGVNSPLIEPCTSVSDQSQLWVASSPASCSMGRSHAQTLQANLFIWRHHRRAARVRMANCVQGDCRPGDTEDLSALSVVPSSRMDHAKFPNGLESQHCRSGELPDMNMNGAPSSNSS